MVPVNDSDAFGNDGFDKKEWLQQHKVLRRDYLLEDRDRFRPLLRVKKDPGMQEFMDEIERFEKKQVIGLMREFDQIKEFVDKQK